MLFSLKIPLTDWICFQASIGVVYWNCTDCMNKDTQVNNLKPEAENVNSDELATKSPSPDTDLGALK